MLSWADEAEDGIIRLHSRISRSTCNRPSSRRSCSCWPASAARARYFRVFAISDLGWPVSLLDLALDVLAHSGSPVPVYVSGYDQGYEEIPFPGSTTRSRQVT